MSGQELSCSTASIEKKKITRALDNIRQRSGLNGPTILLDGHVNFNLEIPLATSKKVE